LLILSVDHIFLLIVVDFFEGVEGVLSREFGDDLADHKGVAGGFEVGGFRVVEGDDAGGVGGVVVEVEHGALLVQLLIVVVSFLPMKQRIGLGIHNVTVSISRVLGWLVEAGVVEAVVGVAVVVGGLSVVLLQVRRDKPSVRRPHLRILLEP